MGVDMPLSFVWGLCNMPHVLCSLAFPVLLRYQFVIMFNYDIVDFFMAWSLTLFLGAVGLWGCGAVELLILVESIVQGLTFCTAVSHVTSYLVSACFLKMD